MATIVLKFGGTSVGSTKRILAAARRMAGFWRRGYRVIVVVSAMGHTTDRLIQQARRISDTPVKREMDMLLTTGERVTMALVSIALQSLGVPAVSFTGSQVGIITDERHSDARILEIRGERIREALRQRKVPIIAGFQGVSLGREITTLGRGGSDTTAVACAVAFRAERCKIFTDVDGVHTEDPRLFTGVRLIRRITYDEMLELATRGAQVLHPRACAIAARFGMPVEVLSSFHNRPGTIVTKGAKMEKPFVRAMTHDTRLYMAVLEDVPKNPRVLSQIITELAHHGVRLRFFFHGISDADRFDLSFILPLEDQRRAQHVLEGIALKLKARRLRIKKGIAALTLVGPGTGSSLEILTRLLDGLSRARAHIEAVTTSSISITCFIDRKRLKRSLQHLLKGFGLKTR
jgi:aspartate kinase